MQRSAPPRGSAARWLPASLVLLGAGIVATGLLLSAPRAGIAQAEATSVHYSAGWNMVAAPSGTELQGTSGAQYSYDGASKGYVQVNPGELIAGHAAWAYFATATTQPLGRTAGNYSRVHVPANAWVLAGNPSSTLTLAISGADAAEFDDPVQGAYVAVTSLAPGQGAWVTRFTDGYVLIGTPGSDAVTAQAQQVEGELLANPTDRGALDQAATVGSELLQRRSYDAVQAETDNFRAAAEEGMRAQGAAALMEMTPRETQATRAVRDDLAQAQEATGVGNSAGADIAVGKAVQEGMAAQTDGLAVATGVATATPGPGTVTLRYEAASTPAQLAAFGTLLRTGFLGIGLGQPLSDGFWSVGTALLNGTPPPMVLPAAPKQTATPRPAPTLTVTPVSGLLGATITVQGTGFTPNRIGTLTLCGGVMVGSAQVAQDGTISTTFVVPNLSPGLCPLTFTTQLEGPITMPFTILAPQQSSSGSMMQPTTVQPTTTQPTTVSTRTGS